MDVCQILQNAHALANRISQHTSAFARIHTQTKQQRVKKNEKIYAISHWISFYVSNVIACKDNMLFQFKMSLDFNGCFYKALVITVSNMIFIDQLRFCFLFSQNIVRINHGLTFQNRFLIEVPYCPCWKSYFYVREVENIL